MSFSFVVILFVIGAPIPIFSPIKLLGLLYCGIVFFLYIRNVILYPPWYCITSERLLEAKGKRIVKEVELSRYGDRPIKDFIAMRVDHHANERGSSPVYDITFYDPDKLEPLIMFNDIWYLYTDEYELFWGMKECPSCGTMISPNIESCYECGQHFV